MHAYFESGDKVAAANTVVNRQQPQDDLEATVKKGLQHNLTSPASSLSQVENPVGAYGK